VSGGVTPGAHRLVPLSAPQAMKATTKLTLYQMTAGHQSPRRPMTIGQTITVVETGRQQDYRQDAGGGRETVDVGALGHSAHLSSQPSAAAQMLARARRVWS
jgi:hypothetical protein